LLLKDKISLSICILSLEIVMEQYQQ